MDFIEQLVQQWTDPSNPANRLKRPAKRTCFVCQGTYKSQVSILCDDGMCSDNCRQKSKQMLLEMQRLQQSSTNETGE